MNIDLRNEVIEDLLKEAASTAYAKGKAYSGEDDSLANFKRNAERLGATKYQILAIYLNKHLDSIMNAIKENPEFPVDSTEGMRGRIIDAVNYLTILWSLIQEDIWEKEKKQNTVQESGTLKPYNILTGKTPKKKNNT